MAKQMMDIRVIKGFTYGQSNEHLRVQSERSRAVIEEKGNYDSTRRHLNFEIVKGCVVAPVDMTRSIPRRIRENLAARGIEDPNDRCIARGIEPKYRTVVNFMLGGSRDRMRELTFGDQEIDFERTDVNNSHIQRKKDIEEWAKDVYRFISDKFGDENIAAFVVHLDETNPHIHCTLLPIQDGKFAYKKIFAGKDKFEFSARTKALHNDFAEVNKKWGLDRGDSISETGAKHRSTEEYRRALTADCTEKEKKIEAADMTLAQLYKEIKRAEIRLKGLNTMINNLRTERREKEAELLSLKEKGDKLQEDLSRQQKVEKELAILDEKLEDKTHKYEIAVQLLNELEEKRDELKQRIHSIYTEGKSAIQDDYNKMSCLAAYCYLNDVAYEHIERMKALSKVDPELANTLFDGSLLQDIAEDGEDLIKQSVSFFAGMLNDASSVAQGVGGGSGASKGSWGRKKDEDDLHYMHRCTHQGRRMIKEQNKNKNKSKSKKR